MDERFDEVSRHYGGARLREEIEQALREAGIALDAVTTRDLAPVDEFHSRGRRATRELAALAAPTATEQVLDVGCGLGGPARYLAQHHGCQVTGIDLTPAFCDVANWLNALTGLDSLVTVHQGSATQLPFADASFDLVWTMQMQMNIEDKQRLYAQIHRVLRSGGRYVLQELCAGEGGECHYPTPWASHSDISYMVSADMLCAEVQSAGLRTVQWTDTTTDALAWYEQQQKRNSATASSPLGIHLTMGERADDKRANVVRNYREGRLRQVMGVFSKD